MATSKPKPSPEEIEAMRRLVLNEGKTYEEVGRIVGLSHARVWQLVGPRGRDHPRKTANRPKAAELHGAGKSDAEIAKALGITTVTTVRKYLRKSGIELPHGNRRYTQQHAIWCARKWKKLFGYTPGANDWSPSNAKRQGHPDWAERFYAFQREFNCPTTSGVQKLFAGGWSEMIRRAGLKPAPQGAAARGRREKKSRS